MIGRPTSWSRAETYASSAFSGSSRAASSRAAVALSSEARHSPLPSRAGIPILLKMPPIDSPNTSDNRFLSPIRVIASLIRVTGRAGAHDAELARASTLLVSDGSASRAAAKSATVALGSRWSWRTFIGTLTVVGSSRSSATASDNCLRRRSASWVRNAERAGVDVLIRVVVSTRGRLHAGRRAPASGRSQSISGDTMRG